MAVRSHGSEVRRHRISSGCILGRVVGRTYLERGRPVVVLVRWTKGAKGPRNVLIRREDGSLVVRPFRGLRLPKADV